MISGIGKSEDYDSLLLPLTAKIEKQKQLKKTKTWTE